MKDCRELAKVFHPGEIIRDEIDERGWTVAQFSEAMGLPIFEVEALLNGKKRVTVSVAERLGRAFDTSVVSWLNMQKAWDKGPK